VTNIDQLPQKEARGGAHIQESDLYDKYANKIDYNKICFPFAVFDS